MKLSKRFLSILLSLCLIFALLPAIALATEPEYITYAQDTVQGGAILHCFNWSFDAIREAMPQIAAAGYTAVQTSPIQQPKDYNPTFTNSNGEWWKLYQPLGMRIAPTGTSWLGDAEGLTAMCAEAEKYGIKVIVDVVANHLANKTGGGNYEQLSDDVDPEFKNPDYFHPSANGISFENRYNITQYQMGMPDLNTGNVFVQQKVIEFLESCVECGVDGFRFDAAKHIELPTDDGCGSDFWPNVIGSINKYAATKNVTLFIYGEILSDAGNGASIDSYTQYMAVTDNDTGNNARNFAVNKNVGGLAASNYEKGTAPINCVLWAESHDTYEDNASRYVSDEDIVKTWAIVGARADSTSLYLARPNAQMGLESSDTTWKSTAVAEINKFKNHFDGAGEYLSYHNDLLTTYIERGTGGVSIAKLDGAGEVDLPVFRMAEGTYVDQITGNVFTVSNGRITGYVGDTGVAVVYNPGEPAAGVSQPFETGSTIYFKPNANWKTADARFAIYLFNSSAQNTWVSMTSMGNDYYYAVIPEGYWDSVIFCRMNPGTSENNWSNKWNQSADIKYISGADCYTLPENAPWDDGTGSWNLFNPPAGTDLTQSGYVFGVYGDDAVLLRYNGMEEEITIPDTVPNDYSDKSLRGKAVVSIGAGAFKENLYIKHIILPDSITSIGGRAFAYCSYLSKVVCDSEDIAIAENAFERTDPDFSLKHSATALIAFLKDAEKSIDFADEHTPTVKIEWALDHRSATASVVCAECGELIEDGLEVSISSQVLEADPDNGIYGRRIVQTATATYDSKEYTSTVVDYIKRCYVGYSDETNTMNSAIVVPGNSVGVVARYDGGKITQLTVMQFTEYGTYKIEETMTGTGTTCKFFVLDLTEAVPLFDVYVGTIG